jgi:hypothetical protein
MSKKKKKTNSQDLYRQRTIYLAISSPPPFLSILGKTNQFKVEKDKIGISVGVVQVEARAQKTSFRK